MSGESNRDVCPLSQHVDGWSHGWQFQGDDPYIECAWCHEVRDALTGRVLYPIKSQPKQPTELEQLKAKYARVRQALDKIIEAVQLEVPNTQAPDDCECDLCAAIVEAKKLCGEPGEYNSCTELST